MAVADLDNGTLSLLNQLQTEDLEEMNRHQEEKPREGVTDTQLAIATYKAESETQRQLQQDLSMSESIARAVGRDANTISDFVSQKRQATRDRQVGRSLRSG